MKFRIRPLLIAITLIAMLLTLVPQYMRYRRWHETKQQLTEWSSRLKRTPFKDEAFVKMNIDLPNGTTVSYFVSTTERLREVDGAGNESWLSTVETSRSPDPKRYFVVPPGKWVDTIDEVILTWDNHRDAAIKQ
ncbi:MAG: hypothetical protein U0795_11460 [Pirellulales bacterium]